MKTKFRFLLCATLLINLAIAGCNIFNPTENVNIDNTDDDALAYEGYVHFRNAEYSEARHYFEKALAADSSNSEAWYGIAKCILMQENLNVFEMLKFANADNGYDSYKDMDDETADKYVNSIDSVLNLLDYFIFLDSAGRTDQKVTYRTIASSYTVLQLAKMTIYMRDADLDISKLFRVQLNPPGLDIDWPPLDKLGSHSVEFFQSMGKIGKTIQKNPSVSTEIIRSYAPGAYLLSDSALSLASTAMAGTLVRAGDGATEEKISRYVSIGNMRDDDGDGCVDEEISDGFDNDGDGEIDEDMRDNMTIMYEPDLKHLNKPHIKKLSISEEYKSVDINGNGVNGDKDDDEWNFLLGSYNERESEGNYLFAFASRIEFVTPDGEPLKYYMDLAKNDTDVNNIQYSLEWRKKHIGGCWKNYNQERFLKWFEGRGE